jgi:hypothetical protein
MHATTVLLPVLAFAMGISAAPKSLRSVARAVPDINEVARNPAPIDHRVGWDDHGKPTLGDIGHMDPEELKKLQELIKHLLGGRAVADAESIVVDRSSSDVHQSG